MIRAPVSMIRWAPLAAIPAALAGWRLDPAGFLGCYLVVWWFWLSLCMGVLANGWLHTLSGGEWGEALAGPVLAAGPSLLLVAVLSLPLLGGLHLLYPWTGGRSWEAGLAAPGFKQVWLIPAFFVVRALGCLVLWSVLGWCSLRPQLAGRRGFAALALLAYGFTISIAAVDWIMSLMPLWYSSVFGLLCGVVQMLGGMALAILWSARRVQRLLSDLGNLLLMYVLCWAYLEYVQFLIIWSANLPHEILWYEAREDGIWLVLDWLLAIFLLAVPLLMLMQRRIKQSPRAMRWLSLLVLIMVFLHTCWLVLPSLPGPASRWIVQLPLAGLTVAALALLPHRWQRRRAHV